MNLNTILFILFQGIEILTRSAVMTDECVDVRKDCKTLANGGWCSKRTSAMKKICAKSCDLCQPEVNPLTTAAPRQKISLNLCENQRTDCSLFKEAGWCEKKPSTMLKICAPVCNFCKEGEEIVAQVTVAATTTITIIKRQENGCEDMRQDCDKLNKEYGWCVSKKSAMEKLCAKTCEYCKNVVKPVTVALPQKDIARVPPTNVAERTVPVCNDRMEGCSFMLTRGWCTNKKNEMESRCRKTCGLCDPCSDHREDCFEYKTFGWCESKRDEMAHVCARTCNLCDIVPTAAKPIAEVCQDKRTNCYKMKELDFCASRQQVMMEVCPATCGFCSDSNPNQLVNKIATTITPVATQPRVSGCKDDFGRERCEYYAHIGWCTKHERIKQNCHDTCVCNYKKPEQLPKNQKCEDTDLGCCWDKETTKRDADGSNCPECSDDKRFVTLCGRFGGDCTGSGNLAKSLHKHCPKTCKLC